MPPEIENQNNITQIIPPVPTDPKPNRKWRIVLLEIDPMSEKLRDYL